MSPFLSSLQLNEGTSLRMLNCSSLNNPPEYQKYPIYSIPPNDQHTMLNSILAKDKRWKLSYSVLAIHALITIHTPIVTRAGKCLCSGGLYRGPEGRSSVSGSQWLRYS